MTKSELTGAFAEQFCMTLKDARVCVDTLFDSISNALAKGKRIEIRGFGTFKVKEYAPYSGRNPKTSEPIQIRGKKLPCFKLSSILRQPH